MEEPAVERRKSTPEEREQWKLMQAPWIQRAMNTTLLTAAGSFSGFILGGLAFGTLASQAAAQSPIKLADGGLETILWGVATFFMGLLVYILKGWVDNTTAKVSAQEIAIARLREELAFLRGQHQKAEE